MIELAQNLFTLPVGWTWTKLGEIAEIMDVNHKMPRPAKDGILFISPKDFDGNYEINWSKAKRISEQDYVELSKKCKPEKGDLIYSRIGTIGKVRKVPSDVHFQISYSLCLIRPLNDVKKSSLLYVFLQSPFIMKQAMAKRRSIGVPDLGLGDIKKFEIALPPIQEQYRIVEKVEELFSFLDAGVASLRAVQVQLKRYRQAVLKAAFEGKLTQQWKNNHKNKLLENAQDREINCQELPVLPDGWAWKKLDELCSKITDGTHFTPVYEDEGIPFISVKDIYDGKIHFDDCKFISKQAHEQLIKRCHPEYRDVLITKSGTIGRIAVIKQKKAFSLFVSVALLKPIHSTVNSDFLSYALENYINGIDIKQAVKGGVIKNLHIEDLKEINIPICHLEEQQEIVNNIDKQISWIDTLKHVIERSRTQSELLRQSILRNAFEGKLVPQNPADEPAERLLERIKAESFSSKSKNNQVESVKYVK